MEKKRLPIGIDDFAEVVRENFYYVDKTGMIKELLNNWGKVNLFTRPRRFGKSLNMSMLQRFFEIGTDKSLFDGLAIAKETRLCEPYQRQDPVVSVSLQTVEGNDYE
ncbi:MAG: AAA family ATPase, partial [Clostridiales bacterium]|nr:AAA family ATPase [Clostridiales bacterium]